MYACLIVLLAVAYISETKFHCGAVSLGMRPVVNFSFSTCTLTYNSLLAEGGGREGEGRERETERETQREREVKSLC